MLYPSIVEDRDGRPCGLLPMDPDAADPNIDDFVTRVDDWLATWSEELEAAGDELWERGCGW